MKARTQRAPGERAKDVLQSVGILCSGGLFAMIAHKACVDIASLGAKYSGAEFWARFARYVIANLGG